jgi:hypothetical protein
MARDQKPVSDADIEALREEMAAQREAIRETLADDLGGEPDDYDARKTVSGTDDPITDDGE